MDYKLTYLKPVARWDEAIPLGCGQNGALIWGAADHLRFSLDRTDIWDVSTPKNTDRPDFTYRHMVELARAGDVQGIRDLFDAPYNYPAPTKLPAGKLVFSFRDGTNVRSELDMETAEASLEIAAGDNTYYLRAFCHAQTKTGMIEIQAPSDAFTLTLENPEFSRLEDQKQDDRTPENLGITHGSLKDLYYPAALKRHEGGKPSFTWFTQETVDGFSFGIVMGKLQENDRTLIAYRIVTSGDGEDWIAQAKAQIGRELENGYDDCIQSHYLWWRQFWQKSAIDVPDELFRWNWYMTNYLLASCSRKGCFPMPLQGVWTADDGNLPPWKGDYHNDLNTQVSYTHCYKANHLEEAESFIDYLWDMREAGRKFAKRFYHTDGLCLPGTMTIDGKPLGGWGMYSLSPTNQIWLTKAFDLYYRCTDDRKFLEEKACPYLTETAECMEALLEEGEDGKLYLPISSSPEIHDDEIEAFVTPNSNYDLALLRYLFRTLAEYAEILDNGKKEKWQSVLSRLPELALTQNHVLKISPDETLEESHRHHANAMAIWPLDLLQYDNAEDKKIIDAVILDYERLGTGAWVGFSFGWMAEFYAIAHNGEGAFHYLRSFWENICSTNGFHLNGDFRRRGVSAFHYRPFTLESNMLAADALQEMLMQSRGGEITLFPAIPERWESKSVSFRTLRAEHGVLVSAKQERGKLVSLELVAEKAQTVTVTHPSIDGGKAVWTLNEGERKSLSFL